MIIRDREDVKHVINTAEAADRDRELRSASTGVGAFDISARPRQLVPIALFLGTGAMAGCQEIEVAEADILPAFEPGDRYESSALPGHFEVEEHAFVRPDGTEVFGVSVIQDESADGLIYYGGNLESVDRSLEAVVGDFGDFGLNLYFFDRRGQGRSGGSPSAATAGDDARAVFDHVRTRTDEPLIVHGFSLGGFEAVAVAREREVAGVVLEATATNVDDFANAAIPWYLRPFIRLEIDESLRGMDNGVGLSDAAEPLLLLAGEDDEQTPPELTQALYEASGADIRMFRVIERAGHNDIVGRSEAQDAYCEFLNEIQHGACGQEWSGGISLHPGRPSRSSSGSIGRHPVVLGRGGEQWPRS